MDGPLWPPDWQTGWVSWRHINVLGEPINGTVDLSLAVIRTISPAYHTTVYGGSRTVTLVDGMPSGDFVTYNSNGTPCVEFPLSNDPDIVPSQVELVAVESWSGQRLHRLLTSAHTLENPLWLSGDLASVVSQPGVIAISVWKQDTRDDGIPTEGRVRDWVLYRDTGLITEITST